MYDIKRYNGLTFIQENERKKISEWNSLHDITNTSKLPKNLNIHCYTILHVCTNTRKGRAQFNKNRILLDSGCSSTIVM